MNIYDKYLLDLLLLNPTFNDYINIEYINKFKHIQPNIYLNSFNDKINNLDKKYLNFLKNIKMKDKNIKIFKSDLSQNIKINYDYLCLNLLDNIFLEYILNSTGTYLYNFNNIKDYEDYIKRLSKLDAITNSIIKLLKKGIKKNVKHTTLVINTLINYFKDTLNNKSYKHIKKIPVKIKNKYENSIEKYLVKNIKKIIIFLENNYIEYTNNNFGLYYI